MTIGEKLPSYYLDRPGIKYFVEEMFTVNGHQVAWMDLRREDTLEIFAKGLYCECDFTSGVGYEARDGHIFSLDGEKKCIPRKSVCFMRQQELRDQYLEQYKDPIWGRMALQEHVPEIILDLIEKVKDGQFIGEDGNGASFWGGYFYLQTPAAICDVYIGHMWEKAYKLCEEKKITLEGAVVCNYREPPPQEWDEWIKVEKDGFVVTASLPGNRQMAQEWKIKVFNPEGKEIVYAPGVPLSHDPIFGPDIEDVHKVEDKLDSYLKLVTEKSGDPKDHKTINGTEEV